MDSQLSPTTSKSQKETEPLDIVILGAGGFAREVVGLLKAINQVKPNSWNILGYWGLKTDPVGKYINGVPVIDPLVIYQRDRATFAAVAIGDPLIRERAANEAIQAGCMFPILIHPSVILQDEEYIEIGPGTILCAGNILTANLKIGAHVHMNLDCTIGHDCVIEDYVTISPGCHLSGNTHLRRSVFLGTGAVTIEKRTVGERSKIGAGAVVVKDIPPDVTAVGIPAQVIKRD